MDPAAVDRVLCTYPIDDLRAGYAPAGENSAQSGAIHFQLRTINAKRIVVVRFGQSDTAVFQELERPDEIAAYLGKAPDNVVER